MRKYTTPTLNMNLKKKDGTTFDVPFLYLIFSMKNNSSLIERQVPFDEVIDGAFFNQADTRRNRTIVD